MDNVPIKLCSMLCGSLGGRGVCKIMGACIFLTEFLCGSPKSRTNLLISYTPIQNKKFKKLFYVSFGEIQFYATSLFLQSSCVN